MTCAFFTGFESGYWSTEQTQSGGGTAVTSALARSGNFCFDAALVGAGGNTFTAYGLDSTGLNTNTAPGLNALTSIWVTGWLYISATLDTLNTIVNIGTNASTAVLRLRLSTSDTITLEYFTGGVWTQLGSATAALSHGVWHRIDLSAEGVASAGAFATEFKLDGVQQQRSTGLTIVSSTGLGNVDLQHVTITTIGQIYWDDFWIDDAAFIADSGGEVAARPNAAGTYAAWSGTFADVDDSVPDLDSSFISTSGVNASTFNLQSSSEAGVGGTIKAVRGWVLYKRTAAGSSQMRVRMRSNTTDVETADTTFAETNYKGIILLEPTDPATSAAWVSGGVDALQMGVSRTGGTVTNNVTSVGVGIWCTAPQAAAPLVPVVSSISPAVGAKAGGTAVTITGSNFTGATVVVIGVPATSVVVVSDTSITCTTAAVQKAGTYDVQVTSSQGTGVLSQGFTFQPKSPNGNGGNNATGGLTLVVNTPTSPAPTDGDIMYAIVTVRGTTTTCTQASWGAFIHSRSDGTNAITYVFRKTAASEPASYTFTLGVTNKASGVIIAVPADVDVTTEQIASQANASSLNIAAPTLTPKRLVAVSIFAGGTATGTTVTPPTNYTEPTGADSASTGGSVGTRTTDEGAFLILTSTAATGTVTGVAAAAATNVGVQILLDVPLPDSVLYETPMRQLLPQ